MEFSAVPTLEKRATADVLILPFWQAKKGVCPAAELKSLAKACAHPLACGDFKGKEGETALVWTEGKSEKRLLLLGLGPVEKLSVESLRRSFGAAGKLCRAKRWTTLSLLLPKAPEIEEADRVRGICEGLLLTNYQFVKLKSAPPEGEEPLFIEKTQLIGIPPRQLLDAKRSNAIANCVYKVRDLVNGNADDVTPQYLAKAALEITRDFPQIKTTVFDRKRIEKEGMGLLLAVNRGSSRDPAFIMLEYKGDLKSKDKTVLVGKGITYDTGGLNLKPTGSMETMKCDMAGAATVLGTVLAAAQLGLKANVTAVIPSTENAIGSKSYKPGDVYVGYSGKSVEIDNTDAEGRLVLADALAYAKAHLSPSRMIDVATLTGAIVVALGEETTGLMSNNDPLAQELMRAGEQTFERVWRLPLFEEYKEQLRSDVADIKNSGGRAASAITAGLFLQEFVGDIPWAHLDIAGTAYLSKERRYLPKNATGTGVRLLVEFLENQSA